MNHRNSINKIQNGGTIEQSVFFKISHTHTHEKERQEDYRLKET